MSAGDWKFVIGMLIIVTLLGTMLGFAIRATVIGSRRLTQCQAAGYTWRAEYANTVYCIRIDDGRLVGVPLEEVEERE